MGMNRVAPLAGAWIEIIGCIIIDINADTVAPLAGAWIEILPLSTAPMKRKRA